MGIFSKALTSSHHKSTVAKVSGDWLPYNVMHGPQSSASKSGILISEESALFNSAVFACDRAISESIAMLPRNIYRGEENGKREIEKKNKASKVLRREANPIQTSYKFFETTQRRALDKGNGYAELQFDSETGDVVAAWPIPSERVKPVVFMKKGLPEIAYEIKLPDDSTVTLSKDRILHIAGIGFDGLQGYPLVQYMQNAVGLGAALEEYSSLFFKQGAEIPGYVSLPDSFNVEQISNVRLQNEIHNNGLSNAHRWKFLYESAQFTPTGHSPSDSQMTESKVFQIQEVARFYRMPLHKIQETSKAGGYSSIEQFNIEFVNDTLMPWIVNWEQEINRKFFSHDEELYVKFNVNALLRGDSAARSTYYRTMVFSSIMTPNEARGLEDMPPIDGGNERLIPLNMLEDGKASDKSLDAKERLQD